MWGVVYQGYNAVFPAFYQEQFPTKTRVTGFAVSQNIGTMITAFLPTIYAIVAPPGSNVPLIVGTFTLACGIIAAICAWSSPETYPGAPQRPGHAGCAAGAQRGVRAG